MTDVPVIDPVQFAAPWDGASPPLAFVDLDRCGPDLRLVRPPFPLVALGDPAHPAAAAFDAVVEPPVSARRLAERVTRHPRAAAVIVQLLRISAGLPVDRALVCESLAMATLQGSAEHAAWLAARVVPAFQPQGRVRIARDGAVLDIVIDRPHARGAIDRALRDALFDALSIAAHDPDIARVTLRATGAAFGIGADLAEFGTTRDPATAHAIRCATLPAHPLSRCAERVAVHVQGACVGASLELAAFAGRVTAARTAWFQLPELAMGLLPGAGGSVSVPRRIGRQRATLMILSGRRIDAGTALRWGLVDATEDHPPVDPGGADPH